MSESASSISQRSEPAVWSPAIPLAGLMAVVAVIAVSNSDELAQLFNLWWTNGSYGHGLLVLPVSLYLIWSDRVRLRALNSAAVVGPIALVFLVSLVWLAADLADVMVAKQICIVALLMSVVWVIFGGQIARRLAFPIAYLLTAVPVWAILIPPLRDVTAIASAAIVRSLSIPVYVEGNFIQIPAGTFEIADVCAGLRFFMAGLALSTLYAYLNFASWRRSVLFVGVAVAWVVVFNWVRVVTVIVIGHLAGMQHPLVVDHYSVGWILFAVAMVPMIAFGGRLQRGERTRPSADTLDVSARISTLPSGVRRAVVVSLICALIVAVAPVTSRLAEPAHIANDFSGVKLPSEVDDWEWRDNSDPLQPSFLGADRVLTGRYVNGQRNVSVYVAFYSAQRQGAEVINSQNKLFDDRRWRAVRGSEIALRLPSGTLRAHESVLVTSSEHAGRLVRHWYRVGGRVAESGVHGKMLQVYGALLGRHDSMALVFSTPVDDPSNTRYGAEVLDAFIIDAAPVIVALFE